MTKFFQKSVDRKNDLAELFKNLVRFENNFV